MPAYDARERFQVHVQAPATLVFDTSARFDLQSIRLVRIIFWLRGRLLGAAASSTWQSGGFFADARRLGWGTLCEEPGRLFVAGGRCQPWLPDVTFIPLSATDFLPYAEPGQVKIAWTLEVEPLDEASCRLTTETRAVATDPAARRRLLHYWQWARVGIHTIRWLVLPAIRREAETRYRLLGASHASGNDSRRDV